MEYTIIRSDRKTVSLQVKNGCVTVKAPLYMSNEDIENFVQSHIEWINKRLESIPAPCEKLTYEEIKLLADKACRIIPERVEHYARAIGVTYGRITIRNQKSRWGSCSSKGNLNFNCLLMLAPDEVIDAVVVHELCHRKEMNHSKRFYAHVQSVYPEYHKWNKWLKENGPALMCRMIGGK